VKRRKEVKSKVSQRTVEMFEEKRFKLAKWIKRAITFPHCSVVYDCA
jgi:hypothetical protein